MCCGLYIRNSTVKYITLLSLLFSMLSPVTIRITREEPGGRAARMAALLVALHGRFRRSQVRLVAVAVGRLAEMIAINPQPIWPLTAAVAAAATVMLVVMGIGVAAVVEKPLAAL
jgi:hypothetical protein